MIDALNTAADEQKKLLKAIRNKSAEMREQLVKLESVLNFEKKQYKTFDMGRLIVSLRDKGFTLKEVGDLLGHTRERMRQVEEKEREKIRMKLAEAGKEVV